MARKRRGDTHYINNKEFTADIIACKKNGELSEFSVNCFISLANRAVDRLYFKDYRDKEDCVQSAILDCLKYWKSFDESKMNTPNAFAYFTQICKNGYAKQWKSIHRKTGLESDDSLEFISINSNGESSVYSI
jgi:hypothetical protein